jgi:hypothetical protein
MTEMLFSLPPDEPQKKRRSERKKVAAENLPVRPAVADEQPVLLPIGTLDDGHECCEAKCRGTAHDILYEERGEWLIQCCFCLTAQWVPAIDGHIRDDFRFRDGRFAGLTVSEAALRPRGEEYITWAAAEHKRPAVRGECKRWLDGRAVRS